MSFSIEDHVNDFLGSLERIASALEALDHRDGDELAALAECMERGERANVALNEALDIIVWMSGSVDFGVGGKAHEGWVAARKRLDDLAETAREEES